MTDIQQWHVDRRISYGSYPPSEALFYDIKEYVEFLEKELDNKLSESKNYDGL